MKVLIMSFVILLITQFAGCKVDVDTSNSNKDVAEETMQKSVQTNTSTRTSFSIDPDAEIILMQMVENLSSSKQMTFKIEASEDIINENGEKIILHKTVNVAAKQPAKLLAEIVGDRGKKRLYLNGSKVALHHVNQNFYSMLKVPSSIDKAIDMLYDEYGLDIPGADLIFFDTYENFMSGVKAADYYGISFINGKPCHHFLLIEDEVNWQIWIEDSIRKLPVKLVVDFKNVESNPQYTAYFYDWNFPPNLADHLFTFEPPSGSKQIDFLKVEN